MNAQPLTDEAIEKACNGTLATVSSWDRMTRADTAVTEDGQAILHGERHTFNLWEAVSWPR